VSRSGARGPVFGGVSEARATDERQWDRSPAFLRFDVDQFEAAVASFKRTVDVERRRIEVDIIPLEAKRFATPQADSQRNRKQRLEAIVTDC
jgi:hypothetical protein